jgi:hypothetical protein
MTVPAGQFDPIVANRMQAIQDLLHAEATGIPKSDSATQCHRVAGCCKTAMAVLG